MSQAKQAAGLQGQEIWVTRPQAQADRLMALIHKAGGRACHFPVIEINAVEDGAQATRALQRLGQYYALIFISRNAVIHAFRLLPELPLTTDKPVLVAVGPGTREALVQHGASGVILAPDGSGSEALLQLPVLQAENVQQQQIMIVRGQGGRELLKDALSARGARVDYAEVYRRCLPPPALARAKKVWRQHRPDAIVVTSMEGLHNLLRLVHEEQQAELLHTPLVVVSARMQAQAKALGFVAMAHVAENISNEALLRAVVDSFEPEHKQ